MPAIPRQLPLLIAHRGESFDAPENTHAAFDLAWRRGVDAIELDVHLTADGEVVVCHDDDLLRTGGEKWVIAECTLSDLRKVDVGRWKNASFTGERIPTLAEVLARVPAGKKVFVEVKRGSKLANHGQYVVGRVLKTLPAGVLICVISFDHDLIGQSKSASPTTEAAYLFEVKQDATNGAWSPTPTEMAQTAAAANANAVDVEDGPWLNAAAVEQFRSAGLAIYVWTVNDPDRCQALRALGVDGITTDRAAWIREQIG